MSKFRVVSDHLSEFVICISANGYKYIYDVCILRMADNVITMLNIYAFVAVIPMFYFCNQLNKSLELIRAIYTM